MAVMGKNRKQMDSIKKKVVSPATQRKRVAALHRWTRYAIQIAFFILAPGLFSGAFNGVKYLFTQIGAINAIEPTSFVVLLVASVGFTIIFGRFFCSYACAFGTLGDILFNAFDFIRSKTPIPRLEFPQPLVKVLSLLKYVVLAGICIACVLGVWSQVSNMSPWVAFAGFTSGSFEGIRKMSFVLLGVLVVCMIVRERFFCQFLCPMGAVFSLLPILGFSEFTRTREHCAKNCGRCHEACPVDIWPDADELGHGECISCGRCADVCPMSNVNFVAIEKQLEKEKRLALEAERAEKKARAAAAKAAKLEAEGKEVPAATIEDKPAEKLTHEQQVAQHTLRKTKEGWHLLRGTGTGIVLAKAALLMAVCWAIGATRYLPSFAEVFPQITLPF